MPLNKLENFIKNTEGRILYVNPNDLDATDSIENQGNSLTKPFKTIQRAILESARFSYLRGSNNDIVEKTTILLFPGEHIIDNRPGFVIRNNGGVATAVSPSNTSSAAQDTLSLTLISNFDLTQEDNILYKFNSIYGGVVIPRGTSIVGLDLRKTKIRPKYIPNPTDSEAPNSAIFRITGACYFWQFSIFDADENGIVYTDPRDFSTNGQSKPTFSHHKLTCFEYCDGVNQYSDTGLTDLDMYYSKLSNAFNLASGRNIDQKYPSESLGFAKQRPEWEIVGAFATDPINVSSIISGDGSTPSSIVTVTTSIPHNLTVNTPIKIRGVNVDDYNISTKVQNVLSDTSFTYILPSVRDNLPAGSSAGLSGSSATVTIETDTVSGASPYIFNISLRSVWGMQGMHADGSKASGFRSMVVAQFTAVSLQKDDRAFVKYNSTNRVYDSISYSKVTRSALSSGSSSTNSATVYHLDPKAIYRQGWQTAHIKITNDAFVQVVSVFAIGFNKHFATESGGDVSITNSNSNFGQFSLSSDGFKKEAFDKDNKAFITSIVTPRASVETEENIDWISLDVDKTKTVGVSSHLYLYGFNNLDVPPPIITQGYRIGARVSDKLYVETSSGTKSASIYMLSNAIGSGTTIALGTDSSEKSYTATGPVNNILTLGSHNILTGEKVRVISNAGDLPENLDPDVIYYAIRYSSTEIKLATSKTNAIASTPINIPIYGGSQLKVVSKVSDKDAGELGSPFQWDSTNSAWFIHANTSNDIYQTINTLGVAGLSERTNVSYVKRFADNRSLDEKLYKVRVVIPKELTNARDPVEGYVIQESSTTNVRGNSDFTLTSLTSSDYLYNRNPRFITTCTYSSGTITVLTDLPHNLKVNDQVVIKNVSCSSNTSATVNKGYNGTFTVTGVTNDKTFTYSSTDIFGVVHTLGTVSTNNTNLRTTSLPRFERNDIKNNLFIYRSEVITQYQQGIQDGVYYLYLLNSGNAVPSEFTSLKYAQNVVDLYPQLDKDNINDNPTSTVSFAKRSPLGDVVTNDLRKSVTRETIDKTYQGLGLSPSISSFSLSAGVGVPGTATLTLSREHGLNSVVTYNTLIPGTGHTPGTYYNVKLLNSDLSTWDGATAKVVVSGGSVTSAEIIDGGSGYTNGETLYFDSGKIGGTTGNAGITIATSGISTAIGNVVQITGVGTVTDTYARIASIPTKNQIAIAYTATDPLFTVGQYVINIGPSVQVSSSTYDATTGITTFTCSSAHGLLAGNKFRVLDASNNNLGDYIVKEKPDNSVLIFTSKTSTQLTSPAYILKHSLSSNDASADKYGENYGTRSAAFYANEVATVSTAISNSQTNLIAVVPNSGVSTTTRFPLGSYIQIDNEIMRIVSSTLTGVGNNEITVIRGVMGTLAEPHLANSLIRKIKLLPIEFRRPSIMRASGHTFEYLGYGPGNYSTGLPQIQVTTLTEREEFLSQSQESGCGAVLYSGMNSNGDFFNGNTKTISSSGKIVSYDIPKPTVTGQDPSRLSVVFDEVVVKERLLVEGGNSGTVLSQFDGPVTFNKELKVNDVLTLNNNVRITNTVNSTNETTGALTVSGGAGIAKKLSVGAGLTVSGGVNVSGGLNVLSGGASVTGTVNATGNITNGGFDFVLGTTDQSSRGNTGSSRALVKDTGSVLAINYANDFTGGVRVDSAISATSFSGSGTNLTALNASNLASGTVPTARLASGTASASNYLRGDQTWAEIPAANNGQLSLNAGTGIIVSSGTFNANQSGNTTITISANASTTAAGTLVLRNPSGDFTAGTITATAFSGSGASLTSLNANNITTGTINSARLSGSYSITASNATTLDNAANITTGTINSARLSGTYNITATNATNATTSNNGAKAWVRFTGTTSGGITANVAYNVSASIGRVATGRYLVTLSPALPDANYVVVATSGMNGAGAGGNIITTVRNHAADSFEIQTSNSQGTLGNYNGPISATVFR